MNLQEAWFNLAKPKPNMYDAVEEDQHYLYNEPSEQIFDAHVRCYRKGDDKEGGEIVFLFECMADCPPRIKKGYGMCVTSIKGMSYNYRWTIRPLKKEKQ